MNAVKVVPDRGRAELIVSTGKRSAIASILLSSAGWSLKWGQRSGRFGLPR